MNITRMRRLALAMHREKAAPAGTTAWRSARAIVRLRQQVDTRFPGRRTDSDGTIGDERHQSRDSDHNPWVRDGLTGVVTAIDVTHDPLSGCDAGAIVDALVASRDPRITYIIWNHRILSASVAPWTWRPYAGSNPHTVHFHLSVSSNKALYDSIADWLIVRAA